MNRLLTPIFTLMVLLTGNTMLAQAGLRPRGDVNCDWEVSIADVNSLLDSVINGARYHQLYSYATDVNGDKEINIADINLLVDAISGSELPAMPGYSGTLPVMYINTERHRNIDSKEVYVHADWWLDNMGIEQYESIGSPSNPQGMLIKGRGNYTWTTAKKPFRIKLDEKQAIMGMKKNRHYCLLSHADDHFAKLKNTIGFELSRRIGLAYTPAQRPVEVVLNGQYIGLYFLTEKIRVGKNRVNIEEQNDGETDPNSVTGGWLLEIDNNMDENTMVFQEAHTGEWYDRLWVTPHSPEVLSDEQRQYIGTLIEAANAAIYNPDKNSTDWERYIDIDTLACYYIIGEMLDDIEYFSGSCYLYKHRGEDSKLMFGPVWDFGNAFYRKVYYPSVTSFDYFLYQQPCYFYNHWIEEIAKFPHFQQVLREHWQQFYNSGFNGLDIDQFIDNHVNLIRQAWYSNAARWKGESIDPEAQQFKDNIHSKVNWLNSQWGTQVP